jgi:hypothetical protein
VVSDVAAQVDFLRLVFGATGAVSPDRPAEIRVGDSLIMVSPATERDPFPGFLYVYVDDADEAYQRGWPLGRPRWRRRSILRTAIGERWCATRSATSSSSPTRRHRAEGPVAEPGSRTTADDLVEAVCSLTLSPNQVSPSSSDSQISTPRRPAAALGPLVWAMQSAPLVGMRDRDAAAFVATPANMMTA